jgi:hypothetical protein
LRILSEIRRKKRKSEEVNKKMREKERRKSHRFERGTKQKSERRRDLMESFEMSWENCPAMKKQNRMSQKKIKGEREKKTYLLNEERERRRRQERTEKREKHKYGERKRK